MSNIQRSQRRRFLGGGWLWGDGVFWGDDSGEVVKWWQFIRWVKRVAGQHYDVASG